jgi:hypothetical protein
MARVAKKKIGFYTGSRLFFFLFSFLILESSLTHFQSGPFIIIFSFIFGLYFFIVISLILNIP